MRILHINQQNTCGGAANIAKCLTERLINHGFQSELWYFYKKGHDTRYSKCIYPGMEQCRKNILINKIISKLVRYHSLYQGDISNPFFTGVVKRIHEWKPDIIHLHNLHGGWVDLKSIAKLSKQYQIIITMHDEWLLTGHCGSSLDCKEWFDSCSTCHDLHRYAPLRRPITRKLKEQKAEFLSTIAKNKAILVTPSEWLSKRVKASGIWNGQEVVVIHNGIDISIPFVTDKDKLSLRKELTLPLYEKIAFFIADGGTRSEFKDFPTVKKALEMFPDKYNFAVVVAGDRIENRIIEKIKNVNIIKVGYLNKEILNKYYVAADIFIYPTKADNCSLVILEAMAAGLPIISTLVGGNPELVTQNETGILIPKESPDLLMLALLDFIENKYDYTSMGQRARERALSFFSTEQMFSKYLNLYNRCVNF